MIQYSENSVCDKFKAVNFTDKVLVEVKATQQYGHDTDVTDLTTYGTLRDDGAAYIIKYNEELENPSETVCVTVRVQKDESFVEMTRSGRSHACLTIEKQSAIFAATARISATYSWEYTARISRQMPKTGFSILNTILILTALFHRKTRCE